MTWWRVPNPRGLKIPSLVVDAGSKSFRGGQVIAVDGSAVVIRLHLEQHIVDVRNTTALAFVGHAPGVGNPVCCEVRPSEDYAIVKVHPAPPADVSLDARYWQDGETFSPGRIGRAFGGNEGFY